MRTLQPVAGVGSLQFLVVALIVVSAGSSAQAQQVPGPVR
jgi:hypothetical protein